jgi:hypothetical protein
MYLILYSMYMYACAREASKFAHPDVFPRCNLDNVPGLFDRNTPLRGESTYCK